MPSFQLHPSLFAKLIGHSKNGAGPRTVPLSGKPAEPRQAYGILADSISCSFHRRNVCACPLSANAGKGRGLGERAPGDPHCARFPGPSPLRAALPPRRSARAGQNCQRRLWPRILAAAHCSSALCSQCYQVERLFIFLKLPSTTLSIWVFGPFASLFVPPNFINRIPVAMRGLPAE